jgi:3-oxoacyl-[acyl-carrier-protein] synthase-1
MQAALEDAALAPGAIDYVNLHGTATPSNDRAESLAVCGVFGTATLCSSTKGATGHTLGAAGALEAVVAALALQNGFLPAGAGTRRVDPDLQAAYLTKNLPRAPAHVLSNSFGFGGANCSLIFGRAG